MRESNFAVTGVAGFVAPRHLKAIRDTGNRLVAAIDPHDAAGLLDQYSFDVRFFTEIERFDRHLEKLRRGPDKDRVHYVTVCSPNYLHDAHVRLALRVGANAICEKPLVINPWNLDALQELEQETGSRVFTVLQLRPHPALVPLKEKLAARSGGHDPRPPDTTPPSGGGDGARGGAPGGRAGPPHPPGAADAGRRRASHVEPRMTTAAAPFVHESSYVDEGARIGDGTKVWHFCHVMRNATIGRRCNIGQ